MFGTDSIGWKKIEIVARLSVPQILLIFLLLLSYISLPLPLPYVGMVRPYLVLMGIYYWSVYRPTLVPPVLCFGLGIIMDILSGGFLGLNALVLVAVQWIVRGQRRFLMGQPYTTSWAVFALILIASALAQWGLYGLAHLQWPPLLPVAGSVILSFFLFPFVTLLFVMTHRILPVASRMLG